MRVVLDANVVAAALIQPDGWTARQLRREDVTWLAPAFLFEELEEHADEFARKAGIEPTAWRGRVARLRDRVRSVDRKAVLAAADHALVDRAQAVDPDDAVDLAALVAAEADLLWTRDAALVGEFDGLAVRVVPG